MKKIPLFYVSHETIIDFFRYHICLEECFLSQVAHKSIYQNDKSEVYATFLLSDSKNALAVQADCHGNVTHLSRLLIRDENHLNEFIYTLSLTIIPYHVMKKRQKYISSFRQYEMIRENILSELKMLVNEKNIFKFRYLYYELTHQDGDNIDKMFEEMQHKLSSLDKNQLLKINYLIQLSYHRV